MDYWEYLSSGRSPRSQLSRPELPDMSQFQVGEPRLPTAGAASGANGGMATIPRRPRPAGLSPIGIPQLPGRPQLPVPVRGPAPVQPPLGGTPMQPPQFDWLELLRSFQSGNGGAFPFGPRRRKKLPVPRTL